MSDMDGVRQRIAQRETKKKQGAKHIWRMTATIQEENYDIVLSEGDNTQTDNVSRVINRALILMQRLMDSTQTDTFSDAVGVALQLVRQVNSTSYTEPDNVIHRSAPHSSNTPEYVDPAFMDVMR